MTGIRRADPQTRRRARALLVVGTVIGVVLIVAFDRYRGPLRDWLASDPSRFAARVALVFQVLAVFAALPLLAFAVFLWSFGARITRAREFPPPGTRVLRDTAVLVGSAALARARLFKLLALVLAGAALVLGLLLWRMPSVLGSRATAAPARRPPLARGVDGPIEPRAPR